MFFFFNSGPLIAYACHVLLVFFNLDECSNLFFVFYTLAFCRHLGNVLAERLCVWFFTYESFFFFFWHKYYLSDVSQCITSEGCQFVISLMIMICSIIWLKWCLPDFSPVEVPFFFCKYRTSHLIDHDLKIWNTC